MPTEASHVLTIQSSDVLLAQVQRPYGFESPFRGAEFALMLIVAATDITPDEQANLSDAVVAHGCRYAVCWGHECSSWDDSIDCGCLATDSNCAPPDDRFVMTTWHDDEALKDAARFFLWNTEFDDYVRQRFLALVLGGSDEERGAAAAALRQAAANEGAA